MLCKDSGNPGAHLPGLPSTSSILLPRKPLTRDYQVGELQCGCALWAPVLTTEWVCGCVGMRKWLCESETLVGLIFEDTDCPVSLKRRIDMGGP
jgi:hypothetical protein